ncbi:MAG: hypothetical protein E4H01_14335, partial [Lysobacterales bacterium]
MATTVRSILNRASALLNDEEHVRWEESELLEWLNDGQRAVAKGPSTDAYVLRANITTVTGTVQTLPADAIRLVDVVKDVSTGASVHQTDYALVDALASTWRAAATGVAENFFYDERNPKQFEVYPPQASGRSIEVVYNAQPGNATISGNIIISDMYADSLIDYIVYRGMSKDTEDASAELSRATAFYRAFLVGIG